MEGRKESIIYTRLSSHNQSFNNGIYVSIENQIQRCSEYCNSNDMIILDTVTEIKSAKDITKQYSLNKILDENSNINIVFYNITRFSRNTGNAIQFINKCKEKNIRLHFVEENMQVDHYMDLHRLRLGLSQAEYESNIISARVKSNNRVLKSKGWKFGVPKYGTCAYIKNGIRKFKVNSYEKEVICFIVLARIGKVSCAILNRQLKKIMPKNKDPIIFWDDEKDQAIEYFDKQYTLSFREIGDLLNEYKIRSRFGIWSASKVNRIFNDWTKASIENRLEEMKI